MNRVSRWDQLEADRARIRAIVAGHPLPDFITGFDVELTEYDGDPAIDIIYEMHEDLPRDAVEAKRRLNELIDLHRNVRRDIINHEEERYPFLKLRIVDPKPGTGK